MAKLSWEIQSVLENHFSVKGRIVWGTKDYNCWNRFKLIALDTCLDCDDWESKVQESFNHTTKKYFCTPKDWLGYVCRGRDDNENGENHTIALELYGKYISKDYFALREDLKIKAKERGFEYVEKKDSVSFVHSLLDASNLNEVYLKTFDYAVSTFEPVFKGYLKQKKDLRKALIKSDKPKLLDDNRKFKVDCLSVTQWTIREIQYEHLQIPLYQRSYKWGASQVNQLINDIIDFMERPMDSSAAVYRLGSLVLNNSDIVDGQQRLVTISLLIYMMWFKGKLSDSIKKSQENKAFLDRVVEFWNRVSYQDINAFQNISQNLELMYERESELNDNFFETLLDRCQFVVIALPSPSEAFQFFDSQNARGKDLEAHDLLKAFHLRDIEVFDEIEDGGNITLWQKQSKESLKDLFLSLFRIKQWSAGNSAQFFTKSDVGTFKGVSISAKNKFKVSPCYETAYLLEVLYDIFVQQPELKEKYGINVDSETGEAIYPFKIDGTVINGRRFFQMICHYLEVRNNLNSIEWYRKNLTGEDLNLAEQIYPILDSYPKNDRVGDRYVRELFNALVLYYYDKFGTDKLGYAISKFFVYSYRIRLSSSSVYRASIDKHAYLGPFFKAIKNANTPFDVLNVYVDNLSDAEAKKRFIPEILNVFNNLKKIK